MATGLGERDILCGRGGGTKAHSGNRDFREVCASYRKIYVSMPNNAKKQDIVQQIFNKLLSEKYRFVRKDEKGNFIQVDETAKKEKEILLEKIRQCVMGSNKGDADHAANHQHRFLVLPEPASGLVESRIEKILTSNLPHDLALRVAFDLGFQDGLASLEPNNLEPNYQGGPFEDGDILLLDTNVGEDDWEDDSDDDFESPRSVLRKTYNFETVDLQMTHTKADTQRVEDILW